MIFKVELCNFRLQIKPSITMERSKLTLNCTILHVVATWAAFNTGSYRLHMYIYYITD